MSGKPDPDILTNIRIKQGRDKKGSFRGEPEEDSVFTGADIFR